jgi:hypothetical protein
MDGEWEAGPLYAGTTVALINSIEPVGEMLAGTAAEAESTLKRISSYIR